MSTIALKLDKRAISGKKVATLRKQGIVPSVVYGGEAEPLSTQSAFVATTKVAQLAGKHSPVTLTIDGKKTLAMIKTIDVDPVRHTLRHLAFHAVRQNEAIEAEVSIVLVDEDESAAKKAGLVILQNLEQLEIKAKPADLPDQLTVSLKPLVAAGDTITLADVVLPKGVEFADHDQDVSITIAHAYDPEQLEAANTAAAGAAETANADEVAADNGDGAESHEGLDKKPAEKE